MDEISWPSPIVKPEAEWSEFDRDSIDMLRTAYAEGYEPREGSCGFELGRWPEGRSASLVRRGRLNGWQPFLCESERLVTLAPSFGLTVSQHECFCVRPPFSHAAYLALEWMRGRSLESLLADFLFIGGHPAGIVLRPKVVPLSHASGGQNV